MFSFGLNKPQKPNFDAIMSKLKKNEAILVDIREGFEVNQGMIEGANWLPMSDLQSGGGKWQDFLGKIDPNKTIALYCRTGSRASFLLDFFNKQGIDAVNLGGMSMLKVQGMNVIRPSDEQLTQLTY